MQQDRSSRHNSVVGFITGGLQMKVKDFDYEVITNIASNYSRGRMSKVFNLAQGKAIIRVCKPYNLEGEQEVREYPLADFQSAIDFYNS